MCILELWQLSAFKPECNDLSHFTEDTV